MESRAVMEFCQRADVSCATVRVVLDTANEDLPLDFNRLMGARQRLSMTKLLLAVARSPAKVLALIALGRHSRQAATRLAEVLLRVIDGWVALRTPR
jgi:hypothetical protein